MRQSISALVLMLSMVSFAGLAHAQRAAMTLEGVDIAESQVVGGTKLMLNGAAIQKRAFFKTNTVAIYLPEKRDTLESILKQTGPQRLYITALRDFSGTMAARMFLSDFKNFSSDAEFNKMSKEVDLIMGIYAGIDQINKGETILVDWIPDTGMVVTIKGKVLTTGLNNPMLWDISLRPIISEQASNEMRARLLGLNTP